VSIEPSGYEDSEYATKIALDVVNETATQIIWQLHFLQPGGGGGVLWDTCCHRLVRMATLQKFDLNDRFFCTLCGLNMGYTVRLFFYTFRLNNDTKHCF
jgi:hypothetical protein